MKRFFLFIFLLTFFSGVSHAGEHRRFEFSAGPSYPLLSVDGYQNLPFAVMTASYFWDVRNGRFRIGFEGAANFAVRKVLQPISSSSSDMESCRTLSLSVAADCPLAEWECGEFFVGATAGLAQRATFAPDLGVDSLYGPCASPRVGVVLWNRMKISLEGRFTHRFYNTVGLRFGILF